MVGFFVTFEGGEGTGKSTQVRLLADRLLQQGRIVVVTREPGGTPQGEALRDLLLNAASHDWTSTSEALLNYAARAEHLRHVIVPALRRGEIVICDRFMDSTRAYQGYAGNCDLALIDALEKSIVGKQKPDLTIVLDIDPVVGLARAKSRGSVAEDRFERKPIDYHHRLRHAFLMIAEREPERCRCINADHPVDEIAADVWSHVMAKRDGR